MIYKLRRYKHRYNIIGYRTALKKVLQGRVGVYPLIDWQGNVMFYIMHKNKNALKGMCKDFLKSPTRFMRLKRFSRINRKPKHPYKFYYVILMGYHAQEWQKRMKFGDSRWRLI